MCKLFLFSLALLLGAVQGWGQLTGLWIRRAVASTIVAVSLPLTSLAATATPQTAAEAVQAVQRMRGQLSTLANDVGDKSSLKDVTDLIKQVDKTELRRSLETALEASAGGKDAKSRVLFHGKSAVEDLELIIGYGLPDKEQLEFSSRALNAASKELGLFLDGLEALEE